MLHIVTTKTQPFRGLSSEEARRRHARYGPNRIEQKQRIHPFKILLSQFASPLVIVLIVAAAVSLAVSGASSEGSGYADALLIVIIVVISGIAGFFQEYKAERSIEALQKMSALTARVIRDGEAQDVPTENIVVGDILLLGRGDVISADARIIRTDGLTVNESLLTGESSAVEKGVGKDIFMHTAVYTGSAYARVSHVGMATAVGDIAKTLERIDVGRTAFEEEIASLSKKIAIFILLISAVIFIIALLRFPFIMALLTAVSLAVAAIPEGLTAVVVLSLAMGARAVLARRALVRRLGVIESIGAVDVICTDKTGTLTQNKMTVAALSVTEPVRFRADFSPRGAERFLLEAAVLSSDVAEEQSDDGSVAYTGEQTEVAFVRAGEVAGINRRRLDRRFNVVRKTPFSSERKMKSVLTRDTQSGGMSLYAAGAPEILLRHCTRFVRGEEGENIKDERLTRAAQERIRSQYDSFAKRAMRVIGVAYRSAVGEEDIAEDHLVWIGLIALLDPPRPNIREALQQTKEAGIRVIMITGDSAPTASAVAQEIGLESSALLTGDDLNRLTDEQLAEALQKNANIFARTTPMHKLRILEILEKDNRVAMTGDGVNDALALKRASVGVAMGMRGTDVAKEASDIILLDDNFATIVRAIRQGRRIFENIRKFINYLFVSNFAEVATLFLATLFITTDKPILLPVQILWINLLTDGLPAMALGADPARPNIMKEPPRRNNEKIINKRLGWLIVVIGAKKTLVLIATFFIVWSFTSLGQARTALFTGFVLYEFVRIGAIRSQEKLGWMSNKWLLAALAASVLLQLAIVYSPASVFFSIEPLSLIAWVVLGVGIAVGYVSALYLTRLVVRMTRTQ